METEKPVEEGNPQPEESPAPSPQGQPSGDSLPAVIAELQKQIKAQDAAIRAFQSGKDKRWETEVKPMKDQLEKLAEKLGVDASQVKQAQRELDLDEVVEAWRASGQEEEDGTPSPAPAELQGIVKELELPEDDSRVNDLILKHGSDPVKFAVEAAKLKTSMASDKAPSPAEQPLPTGQGKGENPEAKLRAQMNGASASPFDPAIARSQGGGVFFESKE